MIKRLHVPNYEHARHYLREAVDCGAVESRTLPTFPSKLEIENTLRYMDEADQ
ncbi:MAG: hypothetical protein ABFE08_04980 [Armatimonadia bacterium]